MGSEWKRRALVAGWTAVGSVFVAGLTLSVANDNASKWDFAIYLTAASALRHNPHADIYALPTLAATHAAYGGCAPVPGWSYLYQPLLALLLEPLSLAPCAAATAVWQAGAVGVLVACVVWLARRMGQRHGAAAALAAAFLCVVALPVYDGMFFGQVDVIVLGICLAGVSLMRRQHPRWAGAVLAVGAFLKYLPALLLVYYLARRQWGAAIGAASATAALGLIELALVGPGGVAASIFGGSRDLLSTLSWSMTAIRPETPYIVCILLLGVFGVVCLAVARWGSADDPSSLGLSVGEALAIGAMTFASPVVWYHYLTWLLPAAIALLDIRLTARPTRASKLWSAACVVLVALVFVSGETYIAISAAIVLWLVCAGVLLGQLGVRFRLARRIVERETVAQPVH